MLNLQASLFRVSNHPEQYSGRDFLCSGDLIHRTPFSLSQYKLNSNSGTINDSCCVEAGSSEPFAAALENSLESGFRKTLDHFRLDYYSRIDAEQFVGEPCRSDVNNGFLFKEQQPSRLRSIQGIRKLTLKAMLWKPAGVQT